MNKMLQEIMEIPTRAKEFWEVSNKIDLPLNVPYLGMGSSYFATLAFKYMGVEILPEIASEFFNYQTNNKRFLSGVILSQSGRSSEALWCIELFDAYKAITNYPENTLCLSPNMTEYIDLVAGDEQYSSSKTYINTLLALFKGLNFDASNAIKLLENKMKRYEEKGEAMANQVYNLIQNEEIHGIYILGSGPNLATAMQAALILSESTKLDFHGLIMAQYDHGPKETAKNSIVIQIIAKGKSYKRSQNLTKIITASGAHVILVEEPEIEENFSVIHNMVPFNFMAYHLALKLGVTETFMVGGKVTESE